MPDFRALLDTPAESVERPKTIPIGTYIGGIHKAGSIEEIGQKKTPRVRYMVKPTGEVREDVNEEDLEAFGGAAKLMSREIPMDFFLTEDSLFRFTDFAEKTLGIDRSGKTVRQLMDEVVGAGNFAFHINHRTRTRDNGEVDIFPEIDATARLED